MNGERSHAQAIVVTIIAGAVGLSLVIFTAAAAWTLVNKDLTLSNAQTALLSTAFGAMIGIIGAYIGFGRGVELTQQQQQQAAQTAATAAPEAPPTPEPAGAESQTLSALGPPQKPS